MSPAATAFCYLLPKFTADPTFCHLVACPMLPRLPIDDILSQLIEAIRCHDCVVLKAAAGAGKTTRVPVALLEAGLANHGLANHRDDPTGPASQIVMLEPRRIAARTAARRIAMERGETVGRSIGYRVRFDEAVSRDTRVLIVTEGVLLRRLQDDPFLEGIQVIVFDEFHERRLDSDLALAMVRRVQQTVRPDLKILVMSATLDPQPIAKWLGGCPVIESQGRTFPVRIEYLRRLEQQPLTTLAVQGVERVLAQTDGDVLVFLPGVGEILKTQRELEPLSKKLHLSVMPLYGDLSPENQDRVLAPCDQRKVVLATNVAETSITIDGITAVVDTGYVRQMHFDADVGLDRLELRPISKASADQRAGRAGRTQPGICLRLWEEAAHRVRSAYDLAELHRVDLSAAVLRLHAWGENDVAAFPWYEAPPAAALRHADKLLRMLGAIDPGGVTQLGKSIVRFPASPRIGRLLIEAALSGAGHRGATLAALLTERDPFMTSDGFRQTGPSSTSSAIRSQSDVLDRVLAFEQFQQTGHCESAFGTVHHGGVRIIQQVARQFVRMLDIDHRGDFGRNFSATSVSASLDFGPNITSDEALLRSLVVAFPDRIAKRREPGSDRGLMVGGRGVRLGRHSAVKQAELFLCVDIDGRGAEATVRKASEVRRDWLPPSALHTVDELFFHPSQKQVVARRRTYLDDLLLEETPTAIADSKQAADLLFQSAKTHWSSVFPMDDHDISGFLRRVHCLNDWMPDLNLPAFDEAMLLEILRELCEGRRSFNDLKKAPWLATIQSRMDYATLQIIERAAPERLTVPSGNRVRLVYEVGRPPVLPVRIQEVFGWKQTPRIADGRITVLLHLLAPNMRPQQVTDDLASFWANTYADVRKELKRRYPKHSWPEDPLTAEAPKRR